MSKLPIPLSLYPLAVRMKHSAFRVLGSMRGFQSQIGQDRWALKMLGYKRDGFFIDIGAGDGVMFSNTWALEKRYGWKGICIEPDPESYQKLQLHRACQIDASCLFDTEKDVEFIQGAEEYGGIAETLDAKYQAIMELCLGASGMKHVSCVHRKTTTLAQLFQKYRVPEWIDYISIDTQGSEEHIIRGFPFATHQFRTMSIEHWEQPHRESMHQFLTSKGYIRTMTHPHDDFYCHPSVI